MEGYQDWDTSWNNLPQLYSPDKPPSRLSLNKAINILNDPTYTKAVFLRDPMTRFLSAYLDKIRRHHPNAEMRKLFFE